MESSNERIKKIAEIQIAILAGENFKEASKILKEIVNNKNKKLSDQEINILNQFFKLRDDIQSYLDNDSYDIKRKAAFIILSTASYWYFSKKWSNNSLEDNKTQEIKHKIENILEIKSF